MRIFVTGATGFVGSAVVRELINAGHQVVGLARTQASAQQLISSGAAVHQGDLTDIASLQRGAALADGIIHTGFNHDFSRFRESCEQDRQAIEAMGAALEGSDRPFIVTSGVILGSRGNGAPATEAYFNADSLIPRKATELAADAVAQRGVRVSVVRLPQVHNTLKQGLISELIQLTRQTGISAYREDGLNRWSAVHISDAARLYRLALEQSDPGRRYHAVAEEGIALRALAEVTGRGLGIPAVSLTAEQATAHFGWLNSFISHDMSASSLLTQQLLGWQPQGPSLIADLEQMRYR